MHWFIGIAGFLPFMWLLLRHQKLKIEHRMLSEASSDLPSLREELISLKVKETELNVLLEEQKKSFVEKFELLDKEKNKMGDMFKLLSNEALEKNSLSFAEMAKKNLDPLKESLGKLDKEMKEIEKERRGERESLKEHLKTILESEGELRKETRGLAQALRKPDVRGMWGELHLKRVVELSGLLEHCDFTLQEVSSESRLRPDMVVRLPGDRRIVVDAKAPFEAFLTANQCDDEAMRDEAFKDHAKHLKRHILSLGKKGYWEEFTPAPEFVVLFLPAEIFFSAALQSDPSLIEVGIEQGVVLATPSTLIGLLRAIAYGWKQDRFSQSANEISQLGHELSKRLSDMNSHFSQMGRSLKNAVESYNRAIGSLERRVLVSARKLKDLGAGAELKGTEPIESSPRELIESQD